MVTQFIWYIKLSCNDPPCRCYAFNIACPDDGEFRQTLCRLPDRQLASITSVGRSYNRWTVRNVHRLSGFIGGFGAGLLLLISPAERPEFRVIKTAGIVTMPQVWGRHRTTFKILAYRYRTPSRRIRHTSPFDDQTSLGPFGDLVIWRLLVVGS